MSWHFLPELEAGCSVADYSAGEQSVQSKITPTGKRSSSYGKKTASSILSRSGRTFEISTDDLGVVAWISSLAASRANRSASPEDDVEKATNETSGPKPFVSFAKWDPDSRCWRTSQGCLHTLTLERFSETWPRAGIAYDGTVSRRVPLVPITGGTGCGLWATPHATLRETNPDNYEWDKAGFFRLPDGRKKTTCLQDQVRMWPTPRTQEPGRTTKGYGRGLAELVEGKKQLWPTPNATDGKGPSQSAGRRPKCDDDLPSRAGGQLNPMWVEWLMGWCLGWTDLQPLGMDKFQQWLQQHGDYCDEPTEG